MKKILYNALLLQANKSGIVRVLANRHKKEVDNEKV